MKNWILGLAVLVLVVGASWAAYVAGTNNGKGSLQGAFVEQQQQVKMWRDSAETLYAEQQAARANKQGILDSDDSASRAIREDLGKDAKRTVLSAQTQAKLSNVARMPIRFEMAGLPHRIGAEGQVVTFHWEDEDTHIDGRIENDSVAIDYQHELDIRLHAYRAKGTRFKPGPVMIRWAIPNQNVTLSEEATKSLVVVDPPKRFIQTKGFALLGGITLGVGLSVTVAMLAR